MGVKTSLKSRAALYHDLHVLPSNILLVFYIYPAQSHEKQPKKAQKAMAPRLAEQNLAE